MSVKDFIEKIESVIEHYNKNPNPVEWVKAAQEIIAKAKNPAHAE